MFYRVCSTCCPSPWPEAKPGPKGQLVDIRMSVWICVSLRLSIFLLLNFVILFKVSIFPSLCSKLSLDHNEGKIQTLNRITKFNSNNINNLRDMQIHTDILISKMITELVSEKKVISEIKSSIVCLTLKLSYLKLSGVINKIMIDLREIMEFRFNKHLMSYNVKKEICVGLEKQNLKTYGDCLNFDIMSETNYILLDRKIAIICKIKLKK